MDYLRISALCFRTYILACTRRTKDTAGTAEHPGHTDLHIPDLSGLREAHPLFAAIRDWLPLGLILLAYRKMGWFVLRHQTALLEARCTVWDRFVLAHGGRAMIESLGPIVPSALEIACALVYALRLFAFAAL